MNVHESPSTPGVPATRRSLGYAAILILATDLLTARFALTRALDKLPTEELLQVLDEVSETCERASQGRPLQAVTPRDEKSADTQK